MSLHDPSPKLVAWLLGDADVLEAHRAELGMAGWIVVDHHELTETIELLEERLALTPWLGDEDDAATIVGRLRRLATGGPT
ncbi:MAG: hypothetical protein AAGA90_07840 [Actinomycetota bacterium]